MSWKKAARKIGKGFKKTVGEVKEYTSPRATLARKRSRLKGLKLDSQIAKEKAKLDKARGPNPFGDFEF